MGIKVHVAKRQWVAGFGAVLWAWFLYSGIKICLGAVSQGINGLPNRGQMVLYIWVPAAMMLTGVILAFGGRRIPLWVFALAFFIVMAALLPVFLLFGGGV